MKVLTFKIGGIHPPQNKTTDASRVMRMELPRLVDIPLKQHIGAEAIPIVAKGDHVDRGQKIAEASGKISAPVHASISGIVKNIGTVMLAQGRPSTAITIEAGDEDHDIDMAMLRLKSVPRDYTLMKSEEIIAIIANKGVVGLGGATFPCAVKLDPPPGSKAKLLVIDACECEPCLTCDDALMRAYPDQIVEGIKIMMRAAKVDKAVIGIEDNKPQAYAAMTKAAEGTPIEVVLLKARYPQGCEKQLVYAITGKEIPSGGLPVSVGCIVQNVGTAYAVYRAVALAEPLIERVVTIEGVGNFMAPVGMPISAMMGGAEGAKAWVGDEDADVVAGGPMMGQSVVTLDAPVVKGLSGVTRFKPLAYDPDPCIRCASCVDACPMGLEPYFISECGRQGLVDEAQEHGAMDCIECGSCVYSCPSARPLLDFIRLSKQQIRKKKSK